jgi:arsenate reductase
MKRILFICTHNSARSQIAQGLVNHYFSGDWEAESCGTEKTIVKPLAIKAMKEGGIDISHHYSKTLKEVDLNSFDVLVTVCDNAKESCPVVYGKKVVHQSFVDPSNASGSESDKLNAFIKTREEILSWLKEFLR